MSLKTALITGCSSGFGLELAQLLIKRNWQVIATLRNAEQRKHLFAAEQNSGRLIICELDVTDAEQRRTVISRASEIGGGRLDCLVNNAGFGLFGALEDLDETQIRHQLEVNFFGAVLLSRDCLPLLRAAKGKIINVSSILGLLSAPLSSMYSASKFALEGLTEALAYELAPQGVEVCLIEPGGHRTQFSKNVVWGAKSANPTSAYFSRTESYKKKLAQMIEKDGTASDGVAEKTADLLERDRIPLRVRCGWDAKLMYAAKCALPQFVYVPLTRLATRILYYRE